MVFHIKSVFFSFNDKKSNPSPIWSLNESESIANIGQSDAIVCKIFTVIWQYSLLANYNWILMEGLYLHNLIFFNIFTDTSSIIKYIIFGWGLPIIPIIAWIFVKARYEDKLCWNTNENVGYFWITRGPITLSII
ncbi:secretin receptor-like protein, partial [Dinothrombium tinctorium]